MSEKIKKKQIDKKEVNKEVGNDDRIGLFIFGRRPDYLFIAVVLVILAVGLVMMLSASAPYSYRMEGGDSYYYFVRQVAFAVIGIVLMIVVSHVDYRILNSRIAWIAYVLGLRFDELSSYTSNRC